MPGHIRPKDGVASLAYGPGIHAFPYLNQDVDGRDKPGHDEIMIRRPASYVNYSAGLTSLAAAAASAAAAFFSTRRTDQIAPS